MMGARVTSQNERAGHAGTSRPRTLPEGPGNLVERIGARYCDLLDFLGGIAFLALDSIVGFFHLLITRQLFVRTRRGAIAFQMVRLGVCAVPIVSLVLLFVGMVLAFQMEYVLRDFGQKQWIAGVVAVGMLRELAPLLTGVVMSGFAGASIAAELGTMVVGEEILALQSQALDPMKFLVMPRVIATTVMQVCLTVVANLVGIVGGFIVGTAVLGVSPFGYYQDTIYYLKTQDLLTGLVKAGAFGLLISVIACYLGLRVTAGAEGVGRAATLAVVYSVIAIIVTDLVFSALFAMVL